MKTLLKLAAPYIAVGVCWCLCRNAWLTIILYHLQIVFWSRNQLPRLLKGWSLKKFLIFSLPCILGGPLAYLLLPYMTDMPLGEWLARYNLTGTQLLLMIPYFGIVHPILEQAHWGDLRKHGWYVHEIFAGYHALVLYQLLSLPSLMFCLVLLTGVSFLWEKQSKESGGLFLPAAGHILADLGIVAAAYMLSG